MRKNRLLKIFVVYMALLCQTSLLYAENIDPGEDGSQYAYGENVGWLNFEPNVPGDANSYGATVTSVQIIGYVWAENFGWINLDPNDADPNTGIANDGSGNPSGDAWGENVGWINFDPNVPGDSNDYGVTIDEDGNFDGYAWGENIGWVHLQSASPVAYKVQACVVTFEDLANFVALWLQVGSNAADLDGEADNVDFEDYGIFSGHWRDFCPDGWQLK